MGNGTGGRFRPCRFGLDGIGTYPNRMIRVIWIEYLCPYF